MNYLIDLLLLVVVTGIAIHGYYDSKTLDHITAINESQQKTNQALLETNEFNMRRLERLERKVFP